MPDDVGVWDVDYYWKEEREGMACKIHRRNRGWGRLKLVIPFNTSEKSEGLGLLEQQRARYTGLISSFTVISILLSRT